MVYAILDGASIPDLQMNLFNHKPSYICLYRGELEPDIAQVAPYLVFLDPEAKFTEWLFTKGWGNHWGIFVRSNYDMRVLRRHFRSFLTVYDENGKPLLFRYYDPRVLRVYLPTCNKTELDTVFGPVDSYLMEDEDSHNLVCFRVVNGILKQEIREFTGAEEERLAREAAERERRRRELMPTREGEDMDTGDLMQKSLVNFWKTINKIEPEDK